MRLFLVVGLAIYLISDFYGPGIVTKWVKQLSHPADEAQEEEQSPVLPEKRLVVNPNFDGTKDEYIFVEAQVTSFNNQLQLNVTRIRRAREGEYEVSEYMPCSPYNTDQMYEALLKLIADVKNPYLNQLLSGFFIEDEAFKKDFIKHSAAKMVHHGFIGGLLHHSLFVAKTCEFLAKQYPVLNKDLLVTAAILHDIGKLKERRLPEEAAG